MDMLLPNPSFFMRSFAPLSLDDPVGHGVLR